MIVAVVARDGVESNTPAIYETIQFLEWSEKRDVCYTARRATSLRAVISN